MTTMTLKNEAGVRVEIDEYATHYRRDDDCDKHGTFESVACVPRSRYPERELYWLGCPTCREEREAERERKEREEQDRKRLADRIVRAGIPPRFDEATLATYVATTPGQKHALDAAKHYAADFGATWERGESLLLLGNVGNGKTHLAVGIAREAMEQNAEAIFTTTTGMISAVKATWGNSGESESKIIRRFASVDLLVLDEVGSIKCSGREREILFTILGGRHNAVLPTIFTGNLTISELPSYLGDQIVSRLRESGSQSVIFDWNDYRPIKGKQANAKEMTL